MPGGVSVAELLEICAREAGAVETPDGWRLPDSGQVAASPQAGKRGLGIAIAMKNSGFSFGFPEAATRRGAGGDMEIEIAEVHTAAAEVGQGPFGPGAVGGRATGHPGRTYHRGRIRYGRYRRCGTGVGLPSDVRGNAVVTAADMALTCWRDEDRPAVAEFRYRAPETTPFDPETGVPRNSVSFSYVAQAVEVEVDAETARSGWRA